MRTTTRYSVLLLGVVIRAQDISMAQSPLLPVWSHVHDLGAGTPPKLAWDDSTTTLYHAISDGWWPVQFDILVYDAEGVDLTPTPPLVVHGEYNYNENSTNRMVRLDVHDDTLEAVVHFDRVFTDPWDRYTLQRSTMNGSQVILIGSGGVPMHGAHHDPLGTVIQLDNELRAYDVNGWPIARMSIPFTLTTAMVDGKIFCGAPPSFTVVDRSTLTLLPSVTVPFSGISGSTLFTSSGNVVYYAGLNSMGNMDLGAFDAGGVSLWTKVLTPPGNSRITGAVVDVSGNFWVSVTQMNGLVNQTGYLYGTNSSGLLTDTYFFGASIDDIVGSGTRLFLTGQDAVDPISTYVIAFDAPTITGLHEVTLSSTSIYPDPANDFVLVNGLPLDTESLVIIDAIGRSLRKINGPFNTNSMVDVTGLAPGSYLMRVNSVRGASTMHFQVAR
ncbi:MAG: T9SS type A sorting domain-containing protein [Flavobacteriales bacterium]